MLSTEIWDWAAAVQGIVSDGTMFIPFYWAWPARLLIRTGWVPTPAAVMAFWLAVSAVGILMFWRRRNQRWLNAAVAIWAMLIADTPFVAILPLVAGLGYRWVRRWLRHRRRHHSGHSGRKSTDWLALEMFLLLPLLAMVLVNLLRFGLEYPVGYARNAIATIRGERSRHFIQRWRMDSILNDYVRELAREGEGKKWIFTDGLCDSGIGLASGGKLTTLSIAGNGTGSEAWRSRGISRQEDLTALEGGVCGLMRAWAVDRPENLSNAVFQCGFSFLEQEAAGKTNPYGLVMRAGELDAAEIQRAGDEVARIGERMVEFYRKGGDSGSCGTIRAARFRSAQWRVARALRRRAAELDRGRRTQEALAMTELSERLDALNPSARRRDTMFDPADIRSFGSVSPRECLAYALKRANFTLARQFARPILADNPRNPEANFAMAMSHLSVREYSQARMYFERALETRPEDSAILNNLAVTLLELGETEAALARAEAALKLSPDSAAIRDSVRQIQARRAQAGH